MKKTIFLLFLFFCFPTFVFAVSLPNTYSEHVILYDRSEGKVLQEKKADEKVNIASLTKIMTTITAIERIEDFNKEITITAEMFQGLPWDASLAGLKIGDKVTYKDLLYASILPSGAEATQALAITLTGSVSNFVEDMNALAKKIGMHNSHFVNVTGLDIDQHYSTLKDILILLDYSLKNDTFKTVYTTREYTLKNGLKVNSTIMSYNRLMQLDTSRILGSKTGFTNKAGVCISALFESNGHSLILITTKAPYAYGNFYNLRDALSLIDFTDKNYKEQTLVASGSSIDKITVNLSTIETYDIKLKGKVLKYLANDYDVSKTKCTYKGKESISFLDKTGTSLGNVECYYDTELIYSETIILDKAIKPNFFKILKKYFYFPGILIILIFLLWSKKEKSKKRKDKRI